MAHPHGTVAQQVVPAHLDFLALYNPSLGTTDETLDQQIVYFSSESSRKSKRRGQKNVSSKAPLGDISQEEKNERLRQIGLAQGMVEFGKSFSDGKSVDSIETARSRIVLHELESGWWILASISLTQLPVTTKTTNADVATAKTSTIEYSSREVKPTALLLQDLLRAHSTFLLHHASSMSALFVRTRRQKFLSLLGRYWDAYLTTWNVMLHGNPSVNIFGGIKLAASGELGVGVGEEERGSGEREVLEGFVGRIDGMVDLVVSKFGGTEPDTEAEQNVTQTNSQANLTPSQPWLGTGAEPGTEDGAIFLGTGALSRKSLRDVTHWIEDLYSWGPHAYGVLVNPSSSRRPRRKQSEKVKGEAITNETRSSTIADGTQHDVTTDRKTSSAKIPVVKAKKARDTAAIPTSSVNAGRKQSLKIIPEELESKDDPGGDTRSISSKTSKTSKLSKTSKKAGSPSLHRAQSSLSSIGSGHGTTTATDKFVSFLKLGYGTHWTLGMGSSGTAQEDQEPARSDAGIPAKITDRVPQDGAVSTKKTKSDLEKEKRKSVYPSDDSLPHYLVGLMGNLDSDECSDDELAEDTAGSGDEDDISAKRTLLRTVTVELEREADARAERDISIDLRSNDLRSTGSLDGSQHTHTSIGSWDAQDRNKTKKLRVVVYVKKPFIYTFFFELRTESLALATLYKSLHHQLGPLQKPLLSSTKYSLSRPEVANTSPEMSTAPIYDLVWDPELLTVMSTMPNIPDPAPQEHEQRLWSRIEALNTHTQILSMYTSTRHGTGELERTSKTSRGWWVVWARIPDKTPKKSSTSPPSFSPLGAQDSSISKLQTEDSMRSIAKRSSAPSMTPTSVNQSSMYSGPAHPFWEAPLNETSVSKDKEIILIRQASDYARGRLASVGITGEGWKIAEGWGSAPAKLAQGIGVDTKRYIEGLLSMGR